MSAVGTPISILEHEQINDAVSFQMVCGICEPPMMFTFAADLLMLFVRVIAEAAVISNILSGFVRYLFFFLRKPPVASGQYIIHKFGLV